MEIVINARFDFYCNGLSVEVSGGDVEQVLANLKEVEDFVYKKPKDEDKELIP